MPKKVPAPGYTLGRYELLAPLASGGFATVWIARLRGARGFQKLIAVKVMTSSDEDDDDLERMFLDEATLASRIEHPNVVEILDLGEQEGMLYQAMELVEGERLSLLRRPGHVPLSVVVDVGAQAAAGLHAAHELVDRRGQPLGLVHRDVSPQNLLITHEGLLKLVDFGIAKAASNSHRTKLGQIKGKVAYMAPEQVRGLPVDRRTDVFALGIVLYELATGHHPFRGRDQGMTLVNVCRQTPAAPSSLRPDLPTGLDEVLLRALAKDPGARHPTMAQLGAALEALAPSEGTHSARLAAYMQTHFGDLREARRRVLRDALSRANAPPPRSSEPEIILEPDPSSSAALPPPEGAPRASVDVCPVELEAPIEVVIEPPARRDPRAGRHRYTAVSLGVAIALGVGAALWLEGTFDDPPAIGAATKGPAARE